MEEKVLSQIDISEFVLVNNEKQRVYEQYDANVIVVSGKNGIELHIQNTEGKNIGILYSDGRFEVSENYKKLETMITSTYGADALKKLKLEEELKQQIEQQLEAEQQEKAKLNESETKSKNAETKQDINANKSEKEDESKDIQQDITKNELEEQGIQFDAYTKIKDEELLKDMKLASSVNKNSVILASIGNDYKILYKEFGNDEIKELEPLREKKNSTNEVSRFTNNKEYKEREETKIDINTELDINVYTDSNGIIRVGRIEKTDDGERVVTPVKTDMGYPTEAELKRNDPDKDSVGEVMDDSAILTKAEVEKCVNEMRNDNVKAMIMEEVDSRGNVTKGELDEIIEECENEYSLANHEPQIQRKK